MSSELFAEISAIINEICLLDELKPFHLQRDFHNFLAIATNFVRPKCVVECEVIILI